MRVALATCLELPEPDVDEPLLVDALRGHGLAAEVVAWDDPTVDWGEFALTVLRSTWNYHHSRETFLEWCDQVAASGRLLNAADVVRWNSHKGYLRELAAAGVPSVPTVWARAHDDTTLEQLVGDREWEQVVVKPAVSAGSWGTICIDRPNLADGEQHLASLLAERDVMVQQYLPSVTDYGERSLVWVAGELRHAIRKQPRFLGEHEAVSEAVAIADDEAALAEQVLAASSFQEGLLYARIDVARDDDGQLLLMELELIEPSLFLLQSPPTLRVLSSAIAKLAV